MAGRDWRVRREQNGKRLLNGYAVFFGGDENILEIVVMDVKFVNI